MTALTDTGDTVTQLVMIQTASQELRTQSIAGRHPSLRRSVGRRYTRTIYIGWKFELILLLLPDSLMHKFLHHKEGARLCPIEANFEEVIDGAFKASVRRRYWEVHSM